MNLLVPAALAFGIIIPIILVLYFMRPRRQERVIGSTLLWQQALQDLQASRPWQRLRITPLLLLQLLAAIFIILVLTRPAIFSTSPISGDTIVILQASASMQATDVAPNRFEAAKNSIADFIDSLGPADRLSIITMARTPQVLIAESQDKAQLNAALQRARVTNQDADLEQALSLAASLASGHANSQVLVIGDGHVLNPDQTLALPFSVRYLSVGTDAPNSAILALSSRTVEGKLIAFAQIANYSHKQRAIPVELYADSRLVNVQTITLAPGANGAVQWGPLNASTRFLHARLITQGDAMTADHDAWSIVGGSLHGRVLLVTKGNGFLNTALRLQPNITLYQTTPQEYSSNNTFDLTIFDGFAPPKLPAGSIFFINPPNGTYPFGTSGPEIKVSQVSSGNDNINMLTDVDLSSIHTLHSSHQLKLALWATPIITAPETPLLVAGENNNRRIAALGFDLHDTDLPLQSAFPILVHNMLNWFLPPPVTGNGQVGAGQPVTIQPWPGADKITIVDPQQQRAAVAPPFPARPFDQTNQIGIYQVTEHVRGQDLHGAFTVNLFDPAQSQLAPAKKLPIVNSTDFTSGGNTVSRQLREIWPWIAALLLLILCVEWWLFSRSYQQKQAMSGSQSQSSRGRYAQPGRQDTFLARLEQQLRQRYEATRKQVAKLSKRTRRKMTKRTSKGGKHVNI
ncbi:VWA domain-containing protein [Ktedonosporobacter rubrisoli]|uniref:VWA domain-containing protein n=1 Tax=Ktedonosporobacter rubrisoli TaxID=2509675 RepID=A0A4P6K290_KTERU|nr:BatA and WFA domain-containing protein [Ktedonosporobacter rubrisoli]QBD81820.1 VWA domain-containing protein [Ktedonosporobacter rubrisoli]